MSFLRIILNSSVISFSLRSFGIDAINFIILSVSCISFLASSASCWFIIFSGTAVVILFNKFLTCSLIFFNKSLFTLAMLGSGGSLKICRVSLILLLSGGSVLSSVVYRFSIKLYVSSGSLGVAVAISITDLQLSYVSAN